MTIAEAGKGGKKGGALVNWDAVGPLRNAQARVPFDSAQGKPALLERRS